MAAKSPVDIQEGCNCCGMLVGICGGWDLHSGLIAAICGNFRQDSASGAQLGRKVEKKIAASLDRLPVI